MTTPDGWQVTVLISLIALLLYNRGGPLSRLYLNAPSRLPRENNLSQPSIKFSNTVRNCEDVILDVEEGFALLSCDPSRDVWNTVMGTFIDPTSSPSTGIYIWHYSTPDTEPEQVKLLDFSRRSQEFHPLGIEYHAPSNTLFIINHSPSGPTVELFRFYPSERAATHITTLRHPRLATPNSLAVLSSTEFLVTNDHYFHRRFNPFFALLETYLAFRGGSVIHVKLHPNIADGIKAASNLMQLPFANGIAHLNASTIAVASSSMNTVYLYSITQPASEDSPPYLEQLSSISLPFHPDNLSVDGSGKLLIAGHPHGPTLEKVAKSNRFCHSGVAEEREKCFTEGLSWVAEWSEVEGVKTLYVGDEYGTSTTAVRDVGRGVGVVTGLYAEGVYVWRD